jgi:thioesterase domain-containing protein
MAAQYVKEVREFQPKGPYFIGGLSFGGAIAFEMARQLHAQGEEVGVLALFDTFAGSRQSIASLLVKLWTLPSARRKAYIALKWKGYIQNLDRLILPPVLRRVRGAHRLAHKSYVMRRYDGRVTLFVPSDSSLRASENPRADWKRYADDLEILEVPGDHLTMLDEPHVQVLARRLTECLEAAQKKPAGTQNTAAVAAD